MGPIQPPIEWVQRNLPWGVKRPRGYISVLVVSKVRLELDLHKKNQGLEYVAALF